MKNLYLHFALALMLITGYTAGAQNVIRQVACTNADILKQADSIKYNLGLAGFIVVKEASISMESEYEVPVVVPMTQGTWYQFVFIGDMTSRLYEVRMFDWNEKQVVYEKNLAKDIGANVIRYDYIPKFSEYHMIKPVQVNKKKKKDLCGYVILLKKVK